jgi:arginine utilization protein RocB
MDANVIKERIGRLALDFVAKYTQTGTRAEKSAEEFYSSWFDSVEYFKIFPERRGFFQIPGDPFGRTVPWCAVRGEGSAAVVLLHHYDVVDTDDYGGLAPLATSPAALAEAFRAGRKNLPPDAKTDLESGEWLFGRGIGDMKGGGAIQLALCEQYAARALAGAFKGNVVLVGLPDEENMSAGGRAMPLVLKKLKDEYGFDYRFAINSEPTDRTLGPDKPKLFTSSIGKVLPLIYARGALSHAGRVFDGLNPIRMMAYAARALDLNEWFIDSDEYVVSSPATFLYMKDAKEVYDVSLPLSASGIMNVMFLRRSVADIVETIKKTCEGAFAEVIADTRKSFAAYEKALGRAPSELPWKVNVKLYAEVYAEALRDGGEAFRSALAEKTAALTAAMASGEINQTEASRSLVELTLEHAADRSPVIVVALAPPYYPVVSDSMLANSSYADEICAAVVAESEARFGDKPVRHCLAGMSDFSYSIANPDPRDTDYVRDNMLLWGEAYSIPFGEIREVTMPIVNIGPWGKGIHTYAERVWKKDLFERTPHLLDFAITKILS